MGCLFLDLVDDEIGMRMMLSLLLGPGRLKSCAGGASLILSSTTEGRLSQIPLPCNEDKQQKTKEAINNQVFKLKNDDV